MNQVSLSKKIQTIGRGPREYERVREFYIDGDQVVLYSDAPGKYLYYDLDLNFVNEVTATKPVYYNMALDSSNGMIYGTIVAGQNTIGSWKRDDVNKVTELLPSLPKIASVTTAQSRINNSKCILFTRMYDNNIYTFKDGKESVKFVVDFGSSNFPKAYLDRTFDMMEFFRTMKDENLVYGISNAIETDRFLIFMTNLNSLCVYDKVTKSARVTQWLGGESIYSMVPINYADNSVAFVRHSERGANIAIATFIK